MFLVRVDRGVVRKKFGKIKDVVPVPNLIAIQSKSFNDFVQFDYLPNEREAVGLEKVLRDIFPIDYDNKMSLEYVSYELGNWSCTCGKLTGIENRYTWICSSCKASECSRLDKNLTCKACKKKTAKYKTCANCLSRVHVKLPMELDECRAAEQTFSMPLKIRVQLISWDDASGEKVVRDIKEQDIFFADVPVMADLYEERGRYKLGSQGTFLINGVDRVVVSQIHRSPGVVFSQSKKAKDVRGRPYYLARIIPMRGSWLDFEFDSNENLYVRIDKKKKVLVTTFLQALGINRDEMLPLFYDYDHITFTNGSFHKSISEKLLGMRIEKGMVPEKESALIGLRITKDVLERLEKAKITKLTLPTSYLINKVFAKDVIDPETGEIIVEQGQVCSKDHVSSMGAYKKLSFDLIASSDYVFQPTLALTLAHDSCHSREDALKDLHAKIWPGDNASLKEIQERLENLLFLSRLYDLTKVGRIRMNRKLGLSISETTTVLTMEDIIATIRYLVGLRERAEGELDDIDHLGNRRIRLVGELLTNQFYTGFARIERIVREKFRMQEAHGALMPQDFLNVKPLSAVIREFFGTGQLSQFMDQTNPLSEIAHKRRLSALGPGGVMKDRATYEIRDVHTSHYGRICPIETPEGQTIGLISSLATYAMVNDLGFIETPYRKVDHGNILHDVEFLDAFQESDKYITQSDAADNEVKHIRDKKVFARHDGNFMQVDADMVDYIDLSPKQLVSVATALIPFLEHDDASRALMGSNMQRQAVPLIKCEVPIVGTGMESEICKASGAVQTARRAGVVEYVSANKIIIRADVKEFDNVDDWIAYGVDIYHLRKFERSSYDTWIHQTPLIQVGDVVKAGDVLTNGSSLDRGELALGTNLLVAFMPWHGYNFEDAIVLSKSLVAHDRLTSVHIDEYEVQARDTKLGPEEITRDIPNVSETALAGLDEDGIVRIGTRVAPGDILVGKVTLKGDIQYSPEEKLLRAIFGEKSREVRDTSLRVPPGVEGTVIDVKIFSRSGIRKDKRYREVVAEQTKKIEGDFQDHCTFLENMVRDQLVQELVGQKASARSSKKLIKDGVFNKTALEQCVFDELTKCKPSSKEIGEQVDHIVDTFNNQLRILHGLKEERINNLKKGDPLPSGVIKMVKVYVAMKRPISVGDKLAGRHGNKGVVSTIVPREDMPYLADGTHVDIVLNPLGVPSRMNVGQILETALGFAGRTIGEEMKKQIVDASYDSVKAYLGRYFGQALIDQIEKDQGKDGVMDLARQTAQDGARFVTPIFDGAQYKGDIQPLLKSLSLPESGAQIIYDGRSGEAFDQPVTVGSIYMMKLSHMVDDKLHARSDGPYSLVTQQPLGGKAQKGGQRFGEMEVWALEAYGAAHTLREMLTYKSDDVSGRHKVYEAIIRGEDIPDPGLPESFNVLIKELQSLGLQVDLFKTGKEEISE
ncbi:DNA-directed RNA polymerase subunit beta [Candidatus Babeliales bacterium]|nr:DNA-directed RNA polymerase subunit beta [Candidatus Babeliales bacterium]